MIDEARHKGQKACPVESIAHGREFMIAASTCSVGVREPPHRAGILTIGIEEDVPIHAHRELVTGRHLDRGLHVQILAGDLRSVWLSSCPTAAPDAGWT